MRLVGRAHALDHVFGDQHRRFAAEHLGGGNHHVRFGDHMKNRSALNQPRFVTK
jgi:hypothetical protein